MQSVSSAIAFIHTEAGFFVLNYVDDFAGTEEGQERATISYNDMGELLSNLRIQENADKVVPPAQEISFLGTGINARKQILFVTDERLAELKTELAKWSHKINCTKKELQRIIGKLQFVANCVRPGRIFVSRLLVQMKNTPQNQEVEVSEQTRKDIFWWYKFLPQFNGTAILWFETFKPGQKITSDASLVGAGGMWGKQFYHVRFPQRF